MRPIYLLALTLAACAAPAPIPAPQAVQQAAPVPAPTRTPIWKDQVFFDFKAKLDAGKDDPQAVARLFMSSFAHYDEDRAFALDLMSAVAADALVHPDPQCRSGKLFNAALDPLWIQMDGHPTQASAFFDKPENALAADAEAHLQIDAAASTQDASTATVMLKPARALHLVKQADGWRVSEFAQLVAAL